jgi:polysaccharide chain length determinant protein (PEP-CTERM system associated)
LKEIQNPNSASSELLGSLDIADYLAIARRRKWWIVLSSLGLFVTATVVAYRLPAIYRAETVILVNSAQVPDKYVPSINTGDIAGRLTTLEQQVLSPTRLKRLVELQGLYPDPEGKKTEEQIIGEVQKSIIVEVLNPGGGRMGMFRIAFSSRDRNSVAGITNQLATMFIEENLKARLDQTENTAQFLEEQLNETKRQLDEKDLQLRAIESRNAMELPESKPYHIEALANLRSQLQTIQDRIRQDEQEKNVLQSMLLSGSGRDAPTVEADIVSETGAGPYQVQIQRLESRLSDLKVRYGPAHPEVRKTRNEIERLKTKAGQEAQKALEPSSEQAPALQVDTHRRRNPVLEAQMEKLDEEIAQQAKLLRPLQEQMKFHESKLEQIPIFAQQISRLHQDYDILKSQYTSLLDKEKSAEISHALEVRQKGERFEILDAAETPNGPAAPKRILISFAGLMGGLLAGVVLAGMAEMNDESVRTESEAVRIFGKPVLTGVPLIISDAECRSRRLRAFGLLIGTTVCSAIFGLLLSFVTSRIF